MSARETQQGIPGERRLAPAATLLALALTLAVIIKVVVPLILAGYDPAWVAIIAATGVTIVTFLLTEGARRASTSASSPPITAPTRTPGSRTCST